MSTSPNTQFQFPEVRVVEASAGSGKTYALSKQYIQLLLNPKLLFDHVPMRNILALTFTNKAAFEMKRRIIQFLKIIAFKQLTKDQEEDVLGSIGINREEASKKAFTIMEALINNYNFFQVQTIDKFINALLSGCAFKIGLTANFRIKTNSKDYLEYSLDQLIDQALRDKDTLKLLQEFLHHYLYLENRLGWFPKKDMLEIVKALFMQNNTYGLMFEETEYSSQDIIKKKRLILDEMRNLKSIMPEGADLRFVKAFDKFLLDREKGFDIDSISDYFKREVFPAKKNVEVSRAVEKSWDKIHKSLKQLCEEEAFSLFNPYIQIYDQVKGIFLERAARDDVLFLEELNKRAGALFDDDYVTVEELYYRLATRFHHYLIDEFQDTSALQWHNLEKMAEEALSTGGSLFYVGDRKQAIYGFRGGNVALFDQIKMRFKSFNVQIAQLTNNWRSQKSVVEFNNAVFGMENLKHFIEQKQAREISKKKKNPVVFYDDDFLELQNIFGSSQQSHQPKNDKGFVYIQKIEAAKKEDRDEIIREHVLELVDALRKRFSFSDIAFLTRSNYEVEQLTNWLLEEKIPVESERTSNIKENVLIAEIVSFLKFLHSPIDNIAFADFILGDIFTKATGLSKTTIQEFVFLLRARTSKERDFYIYTEFRKQFPEVWDKYIESSFANVGLYPLYELAISFYSLYDCLNLFPEFQGYLMHFLEIIKNQEEEHSDIESFLEYYDELIGEALYVHVTDTDAIKILTVHKSKGLEFPVVIIPFLGMDVQVGVSQEQQMSYILQEHENSLQLLRLKGKYLGFSEKLYEIYAKEYKKAFISELNNIYVAMTRAQHELYAFIPEKIGQSFNLAQLLIPEDVYQCGQPHIYEKSKAKSMAVKRLSASSYQDWIHFLNDEFLDEDQIHNRQKKLGGEVVHSMLSFIGNLAHEDKELALEQAYSHAQMNFPFVDHLDAYLKKVKQLLNNKRFESIFSDKDAQVFTEKEIVNAFGHSKRIDRLIVKTSEVWIVDYKSSQDEGGDYEKQVGEYMALVDKLYPQHEIKGFIVYLDDLHMQEVKSISTVITETSGI